MDIQTYKEFVTLVTHRSFVSAARDLNMSQPTLSRHMAALSKELRHDLFYDSRPLTLTPAGEAVLETASLIIREQDNLVESLKRISSLGGGRIRVLSLRADALYVGIHDAFSAMQAKHPNYRVDYIALDDSGLDPFQMIERDKVDVSFLACITAEEWPGCETPNHLKTIAIPEFHGELAVGIPKENELSKRDGISLKDLSEQVFIMQTNRCNERFQNDFVDCCLEEGFRPKIQPVPP